MKNTTYVEQLAKVPLFRACDHKQLTKIDQLFERYDAAEGEVMVKQGDVGHELYVIVDGKATVERDGEEVATLGAGQWFGELSLLDGARRDATVTMTEGGRVLILMQQHLFGLLETTPTFTRQLLIGLARRLHEADLKD